MCVVSCLVQFVAWSAAVLYVCPETGVTAAFLVYFVCIRTSNHENQHRMLNILRCCTRSSLRESDFALFRFVVRITTHV